MKIKIGIAEDNPQLARALKTNLSGFDSVSILFIASNGQEAVKKIFSEQPDVILMDIQMPLMNGIEATKHIKHQYPNIKVIMLTVFDDADNLFNSILAGATGYLLKDEKPEKILEALEEAIEGGAPMSAPIASLSLQLIRGNRTEVTPETNEFKLSGRELEILQGISNGQNYQVISENLFISPKTVRKHIENIYRKLQVHNKVDAVRLAIEKKIV